MNLKNKQLFKKLLKWANEKKTILIFTMLHFFKKMYQKETDIFFVILGHFLPFFHRPPNSPENQTFEKKWKKC